MPVLGPTYNEVEITLVPLCFLRIFFSPLTFARPDTDHRAHILWRLELAFEIFHDFFAYEHGGERRASSCAVLQKDYGFDCKRVWNFRRGEARDLAGQNS